MPPSTFSASNQPYNLIRTGNPGLASSLLAADWAGYVRIELDLRQRPVYVLDNYHPTHDVSTLERLFSNGVLPHVNPKTLFEARAFLSGEVSRVGKAGAQ